MFGLSLVTGPTQEPVSLAEVKEHLRVTSDDEDGNVAGYLLAARTHVERVTNLALMAQTFDLTMDTFPAGRYPDEAAILIPRGPVQSITSVTYFDGNGVQQTLANTEYALDASRVPARLTVSPNRTWPSVQNRANAITVRFVAGYGSLGAVPDPIRHAILLMIGHFYANREAVNVGNIVTALPMAVDALLAPYRLTWLP